MSVPFLTNKIETLMYRVLTKAIMAAALFLPVGCGQEAEEKKVDYPERTHSAEQTTLVLTKHQLEHIEFAVDVAEVKAVSVPLSLPARVALNDLLTAHITARVTGRVEKVHHVLGDRLKKGDVVLELFSQEFLAMQSEFISAEERLKRMTTDQPDYATTKSIYESARKRLNIVGLVDREIDTLAENHVPLTLLPVRAPLTGTLLMGEVRLGEYVELGKEFFTMADLKRLWVIADAFEHDLPLIEEGLSGEVSVSPYPTETFHVRLVRVHDMVDEKSRTVKVRFEVDNASEKLKPEMFAIVKVNAMFGTKTLKVPTSAVTENRGKTFAFVALNDTTFEFREIKVGFETTSYIEILAGLRSGERVVSKGTFYLKSELAKATFVEEE